MELPLCTMTLFIGYFAVVMLTMIASLLGFSILAGSPFVKGITVLAVPYHLALFEPHPAP